MMTTRRHDHDHGVVTSFRCRLRGETTPPTDYVKPGPHKRNDQTTRVPGGRSCMQDASLRPADAFRPARWGTLLGSFHPLRTHINGLGFVCGHSLDLGLRVSARRIKITI